MQKKCILKRSNIFLISIISLITIGEISILFYTHSSSFGNKRSIEYYARKVIEKCASSTYHPSCYDKEIPKLMDYISMEEAFKVTRIVQKSDPSYAYCHVLGHNISARETAKDPAKWKDVVARCPATMCNNGCLHGALMERFQNKSESLSNEEIEKIEPDLKDVCEPRGRWHPTEIERSMCYHGLGHLHIYITGADLNKSADLCGTIGVKDDGRNYVQTCTEGVFMQIYQPLEPEDFALVKGVTPEKKDLESFCLGFAGMRKEACWRESWPLFLKEVQTPEGLATFCSFPKDEVEKRKCYGTVMNFLTPLFVLEQGDAQKLKTFCSRLPFNRRGECFANSARRLVQIDPVLMDKAVGICDMAKTTGEGEKCYEVLTEFATWSFSPGSKAFISYCNKLPDPWRSKCKILKTISRSL
ncbi:MAG: hypothetical protein HY001_03920 [Candidatus Portnoybacteria bacterium]|nr:hypothetical protein [Candidatus Portnoybacteria bacterium]